MKLTYATLAVLAAVGAVAGLAGYKFGSTPQIIINVPPAQK